MKITEHHYYPESDELDLVLNVTTPEPAVSIHVEDDFYLRVNPDTREVVGATILNASSFFADLARSFALKEVDDSDVRFFLERKVEALAANT